MSEKRLSPKHQIFVNEYLKCWNASAAARSAGYSEKTAYSSGQRLLKDVEISAAINERVAESTMSANEVLVRLTEIARANIYDFVNEDGIQWKAIKEKGHLVKSITPTHDGTKLEVHDQLQALLSVGKHLRLFSDFLMKIDVSTLSDEQIENILNGEDPLAVVFSGKGKSGARTPTPGENEEPDAE